MRREKASLTSFCPRRYPSLVGMDEAKTLAKLSKAIHQRRTATGLAQQSFADSISMHRAQYSKIERGEINVTILTLCRVAKGLGTTVAQLLD